MLAWLNAVPDEPAGAASLSRTQKAERVSRGHAMRAKRQEPVLPALEYGEYLIGYLMEAGPVESTGMGPARLSWRELQAWQHATGNDLAPWEARMLLALSDAYGAESGRATDPNCPPPWSNELTDDDRAEISKQLSQAFRTLMSTARKQPPG